MTFSELFFTAVGGGLLGGVVAQGVAWLKELSFYRKVAARKAKFTALQIATELERFAQDCAHLIYQNQLFMSSGGEAGKAASQLPSFPSYSVGDEWRDMEQSLLARILEFPNILKQAQLIVDQWWDHHPETVGPTCQERAGLHGYAAWELARDLRRQSKLPSMATSAELWDFVKTLKKERDAALRRKELEAEEEKEI